MNGFRLADNCLYCLDGSMPAGSHDILGPVYKPCPTCVATCALCEGESLFPSDYTCFDCFREYLATLHLIPVLCAHCFGVVDLIHPDTIREEVTDHGN